MCIDISCCWELYFSAEWCLSHLSPATNQQQFDPRMCATPGLSCQRNINWSMSITLIVSSLISSYSVTQFYIYSLKESVVNSQGRTVFSVYTGLLSWCVTMPVFFSVPGFCLQFFFASCSLFSFASTVEYITVTLQSVTLSSELSARSPFLTSFQRTSHQSNAKRDDN